MLVRVSGLLVLPGSRVVADPLDRADELVGCDALRVVGDGSRLGGEVDGRLDAVELVQRALDARCAGSAGHPFQRERRVLTLSRAGLGDRSHRQAATS